jgi:hypothetical protein
LFGVGVSVNVVLKLSAVLFDVWYFVDLLKDPVGLLSGILGLGREVDYAVDYILDFPGCWIDEPGGLAGALCGYGCYGFVQLAVALALSLVCSGDERTVLILRSFLMLTMSRWRYLFLFQEYISEPNACSFFVYRVFPEEDIADSS